jgi:hypothetical protein
MRRAMNAGVSILPAFLLAVGPWLGLVSLAARPALHEFTPVVSRFQPVVPSAAATSRSATGGRHAKGCGCKTIVLNAANIVRDARVKTGDATVINTAVTYVSSAFAAGHGKVRVDQSAEAITGDAIVGQLLGVEGIGKGCFHIVITALNDVQDVKVTSGDAKAINRSYVLMDPGVSRHDFDLEVDQEAKAISGKAIAGQIIGALNLGSGPCKGSVEVEADNSVKDAKVKTGKAKTDNVSVVRNCSEVGCPAELLELSSLVSHVQLCVSKGCGDESTSDVPALIAAAAPRKAPSTKPAPRRTPRDDPEPSESPAQTPPPDPNDQASPSPSPTPMMAGGSDGA